MLLSDGQDTASIAHVNDVVQRLQQVAATARRRCWSSRSRMAADADINALNNIARASDTQRAAERSEEHPEAARCHRVVLLMLPLTETRNPASARIDEMSALEIVQVINAEDAGVTAAVAKELGNIARAVDGIVERMQRGGRLIYMGAGTSGRLGVLDASECPPTYSTPPGLVVGIMAGGDRALRSSFEDAEDSLDGGANEIDVQNVTSADTVVGIAASGGTPYVVGALRAARARGALTVSLACSSPSAIAAEADIAIAPLVGPEVVTGSTRMKAGTAQKMVLNMLSSATMIRLGKTYGNLMVDVQQSNAKLRDRAVRIVADICSLSREESAAALQAADGDVKLAIVMTLARCNLAQARARLERADGRVKLALQSE